MPLPRLRRVLLAATFAFALAAAPAEAATCDRFASPFGSDLNAGTELRPFATAQRLADSLAPGQTGCLQAGTYDDEIDGPFVLRVNYGGRLGAPVTIRSAPGQRATLRGIVYLPNGSDHVTLSHLDFDARRPVVGTTAGIQILAADTVIEDSTITNHRAANCMILGVPGWGEAVRTIIRRNVFRACGGQETIREHAIYVEYTQDVRIVDNLFDSPGAYAVHLYPEADNTLVSHNVMAGGGGGVVFASEEGGWSSDGNVVERNVITGTWNRPGIHGSWGGGPGRDNVARDNCMFDNRHGHVDQYGGGFAATGNIIADPQYRAPAAGDFRLAAGSPCLQLLGYDPVAKIMGLDPEPQSTPQPTATASPSPTTSPAPSATAAPTRTATPTPTPSPTPAPTRTATPTPSPTPPPVATAPPAVPTAAPTTPPTVVSPAHTPDPGAELVEAAEVYVDDSAFSFSGGSNRRRGR